jgi:hypothetical protein
LLTQAPQDEDFLGCEILNLHVEEPRSGVWNHEAITASTMRPNYRIGARGNTVSPTSIR